ncbi:MAG TPA: hypothetical protein VGQ83_13950, partial [Polyangia bacterium]
MPTPPATTQPPARDPWQGFAAHLVAAGLLTQAGVDVVRAAAEGGRDPLPDALLKRGELDAPELLAQLGDYFGVEAIAGDEIPLDPSLMKHVPKALLLRYNCVPVRMVGVTVTLAMVDPGDEQALAELRRAIPASIATAVALEGDIVAALQRGGVFESETERGDTAYNHVLDQARDEITAGKPATALERFEEAAAAYARAAALAAASHESLAALAHRGRGYCLARLGR